MGVLDAGYVKKGKKRSTGDVGLKMQLSNFPSFDASRDITKDSSDGDSAIENLTPACFGKKDSKIN